MGNVGCIGREGERKLETMGGREDGRKSSKGGEESKGGGRDKNSLPSSFPPSLPPTTGSFSTHTSSAVLHEMSVLTLDKNSVHIRTFQV